MRTPRHWQGHEQGRSQSQPRRRARRRGLRPARPGAHREPLEILHSGLRGIVAAMSMGGLRVFGYRTGLLGSAPPELVAADAAPAVLRELSQSQRDAAVILLHWGYGAAGGLLFGALPARWRLLRWSGPVYGFALWSMFEAAFAPALGLRRHSATERVVLAADHLLYGTVLSELRTTPRR